MSVQKLAMPGQIAKDVGYFMQWAKEKFPRPSRTRSRQDSRVSNGSNNGNNALATRKISNPFR
jgi:hypothetical protein